jgi:Fe-S-cluster containining protein
VPWVREGECCGCGDCCRPETIPARTKAYIEAEIPFMVVNQGNCPDFDPETGKCLIYEDRPQECRDFPTSPVDIAALPRCTYRFVWVEES